MTFFELIITFIIGLFILIVGTATKKKWLMMVSILPLAIVVIQIIYVFMI